MKINYSEAFKAWEIFKEQVHSIIANNNVEKVAEIGAGANPLLAKEFIKERNILYHLLDISNEELSKADIWYEKK